VLFAQGVTQAPLMAVGYALVPRLVDVRLSEAFAWLTSAVVGGIAVGTTLAGLASEHLGAGAGFLIGAVAPVAALVLALAFLRSAR
jgi:predicted MFS family arabinose efflux permease